MNMQSLVANYILADDENAAMKQQLLTLWTINTRSNHNGQ